MTESPARQRPFTATHVAVICHDGPDAAARRKAASPAHMQYVESILDRLLLAGPLFDDPGATMIGSLYVFKTDSLPEARRLLEADPYYQAGFWKTVEFRPTLPAAGDCVGGRIW
jgi:uncharacterized protein YciI